MGKAGNFKGVKGGSKPGAGVKGGSKQLADLRTRPIAGARKGK